MKVVFSLVAVLTLALALMSPQAVKACNWVWNATCGNPTLTNTPCQFNAGYGCEGRIYVRHPITFGGEFEPGATPHGPP